MRNRLTFVNVIDVLVDNKKRDYPTNALIRDLFAKSLRKKGAGGDPTAENIMFSKWCNPDDNHKVPLYILDEYDDEEGHERMRADMAEHILPKIVNIPNARRQIEALISDSIPVIGEEKAAELLRGGDDAAFFTEAVLYAVYCDHKVKDRQSPILADYLRSNRAPRPVAHFVGRDEEMKRCSALLAEEPLLFVCGVAGVGKSEFVKTYAAKRRRHYTNIIYLFYSGSLKQAIAAMDFANDAEGDNEDARFRQHMDVLRRCYDDTLIILDNFDVYPEDDPLFKELVQRDFHLIVTTRCHLPGRNVLELAELDPGSELLPLFYRLCPGAKGATDEADGDGAQIVRAIIEVVHRHTLTVALAALTLSASGIAPAELLYELKSCTLSPPSGESVELQKDNEYTDGLMQEHLRRLMKLSNLTEEERYLLMNLSLLPESGAIKQYLKLWLQLSDFSAVNRLVRYGFVQDDQENLRFVLHPLIRDVVTMETLPSITRCRALFEAMHITARVQGLDFRQPENLIECLVSVTNRLIVDDPQAYLIYLEDCFTFYDKYLARDEMERTVLRMEQVMREHRLDDLCDKALLLDYQAEICLFQKDYRGAAKRRQKAIKMIERIPEEDMDARSANLLSNLYNNLSHVWLMDGNAGDAHEPLKKAFEIRQQYAHLGLLESHDALEQMINVTNMLCMTGDPQGALDILALCETYILRYTGEKTLDYGVCCMMRGTIAASMRDMGSAVKYLLEAERIIERAVGPDNGYMKTVYHDLFTLYAIRQEHDKALIYQEKYRALGRKLLPGR